MGIFWHVATVIVATNNVDISNIQNSSHRHDDVIMTVTTVT
jgi:hypothetical protein